ncbi:MAG: DNA-deoxyinosine glycosylase [Lachnospiraceae bacterium]|nr:DNA-deoxyinosine glycosylase [Lachnospiraceae bacterium]
MAKYQHISHIFEPVYDENSEILILGSFPSVKSREQGFYYGHPRNRFWQVLAGIFDEQQPQSIAEKKAMLLRNHIAVWDVIGSCDIKGSSDSSIRNVVPADIEGILPQTKITRIFANGQTAGKLYQKYIQPVTSMQITILPSTSPANAAYPLERLKAEWREKIALTKFVEFDMIK